MVQIDYLELSVAKLYVNQLNNTYDRLIQEAITASSRDIDDRTGRYFGKDDVASSRTFEARNGLLIIDDAINDADFMIEDSAGNELDPENFTVYPLNSIVRGQPWPIEYIKSCFMSGTYTVTAKWGWPEVPAVVKEVVKLLTAETFLSKDTAHGTKGLDEYGVVRIRETKQIMQKLSGVTREPVSFR